MAAIKTDVGVAVVDRDIAMTLQVGQGLAFQVKLVVAGHKVGDDIRAALRQGAEIKEIMSGTARHGGVTRATHERVVAGAALHDHRTRAAHELDAVIPPTSVADPLRATSWYKMWLGLPAEPACGPSGPCRNSNVPPSMVALPNAP